MDQHGDSLSTSLKLKQNVLVTRVVDEVLTDHGKGRSQRHLQMYFPKAGISSLFSLL